MLKFKRLTMTAFLFFVFISFTSAADRYVSTSGSDTTNDCTASGSPCATIQNAFDNVATGDTIKVARGTYYEHIAFTAFSGPITGLTLQGGWNSDFSSRTKNPSLTVIDGSDTGQTVNIFANTHDIGLTIDCFTMQNGYKAAGNGGSLSLGAAVATDVSITVQNCIIKENDGNNYGGGVIINSDQSSELSAILTNNIIFNNTAGGVYAYSSRNSTLNTVFTNNTITSNTGDGIYLSSQTDASHTAVLRNNIIWGNVSGYDLHINEIDESGETPVDSTTTVNISYSDSGDTNYVSGTYNEGNGMLDNVDPLFVKPTSGNFHLKPNSPCIEAGLIGTRTWVTGETNYWDNTQIGPIFDFEGDRRPLITEVSSIGAVTGCDIGADEFTPLSQPAIPMLLFFSQ